MLPVLFGIPQTDCSGLQRGRDRFMPIEGFLPGQTLTELTVGLRQGDLCTASAPANALGALAPSHLLSESPPFGCIVRGADEEEPSISVSKPRLSSLSEAAGDANTWHCLTLCLGKRSPAQRRGQCGNSEPSSLPQCLLRFLKSREPYSTDDGGAAETGSQGALLQGNFNRDQGGLFQSVSFYVSAAAQVPSLLRLFPHTQRDPEN